MPFPIATLTSITATGDVVTGPGAPTMLCKGLPVSCIGDMVTGAVCVGAVSVPLSPTFIVNGRPVTTQMSQVVGVNPIVGVPVTTVVATVMDMTTIV